MNDALTRAKTQLMEQQAQYTVSNHRVASERQRVLFQEVGPNLNLTGWISYEPNLSDGTVTVTYPGVSFTLKGRSAHLWLKYMGDKKARDSVFNGVPSTVMD